MKSPVQGETETFDELCRKYNLTPEIAGEFLYFRLMEITEKRSRRSSSTFSNYRQKYIDMTRQEKALLISSVAPELVINPRKYRTDFGPRNLPFSLGILFHTSTRTLAGKMDEEAVYEFRPSWTAWFWLIVFSLGIALPYVWWRRRGIRYEITESRLIKHTGRLSSTTEEFQLARLTRVKTNQSLGERVFGVGTITLDTGVDEITIQSVPNYQEVANVIRRQ